MTELEEMRKQVKSWIEAKIGFYGDIPEDVMDSLVTQILSMPLILRRE